MTYESFEPVPDGIFVYGTKLGGYTDYFRPVLDKLLRKPKGFLEAREKIVLDYLKTLPLGIHNMLDLAADPSCIRDLVKKGVMSGGVSVGLYQPKTAWFGRSLSKLQEWDRAHNISAMNDNIFFYPELTQVRTWTLSRGKFSLVVFRPQGEVDSFDDQFRWESFCTTIFDLTTPGGLILMQTNMVGEEIVKLLTKIPTSKNTVQGHLFGCIK